MGCLPPVGLTQAFPVLFEQFDLPPAGFFETLPVKDLEDRTFNDVAGVHWILAWDSVEERHRRMHELRKSEAWHAASVSAMDPNGESLCITEAKITLLTAWPDLPVQ